MAFSTPKSSPLSKESEFLSDEMIEWSVIATGSQAACNDSHPAASIQTRQKLHTVTGHPSVNQMLDTLPQETLLHILGYLGSSFFRRDVRRLTISRRWYKAAWLVFARDVELTNDSLVRLVNNKTAISRIHPVLNSVSLYVVEGRATASEHGSASCYEDPLVEQAAETRSAVMVLASSLQNCPQLRILGLTARFAQYADLQPAYPDTKLFASLLSLPFLTSLYLDTASLHPNTIRDDADTHLCCKVNSLLPSLRIFRCRMDSICDALLKPPADTQSLPLEELIINLSISGLSETITSYRHSKHCSRDPHSNFLQLQEVLEAQAIVLSQISKARMIRILYHRLPFLHIFAFDAVSKQRLKLELDEAWDSTGEVVDESESGNETDLFYSEGEDSESTID